MKRMVSLTVIFSVVFLAVASIATADVPNLMQYQGFLTDESGEPLDTIVSMMFTIYDDPIEGWVWWTETQDSVIVANGLFNVLLGSVNPISDTVFADDQRWLGITVAPDPEIVPRTRLVTVPYAYRVATVDGASGGAITGDLEAYSIITGVVITGDLDASGNIHASGSISSGSSITIDGTNDKITTTSGMIDFDDENLVTTGRVGIGAIDPDAKLHVESSDLYSATFSSDYSSSSTHVIHSEFADSGGYDAVAVYGSSVPADYYGYGGYFVGGVYGCKR